MVYFIINGLGFNCRNDKRTCANKDISCRICIINKLKEMGFEITTNLKILRIISDDKRQEMERDSIWQKFLDVLNIKYVLIMDNESGLSLLNYPVSSAEIDASLLSGFIQANITFSESSEVSGNMPESIIEHHFFEFQYKDFNILLKNGEFIRICFILDHKASLHMKSNVDQFLDIFEDTFNDNFIALRETGLFNDEGMNDYIIDSFNIDLVFPMTLTYAIPPELLDQINENRVQKAIYELAKEALSDKSFFYINTLLNKVKKIVHIQLNVVLYEIYQLLEKKIIVTMPLEAILSNLENKQDTSQKREIKIQPLSSMIINDEDLVKLKSKIQNLDESAGKEIIKEIMKKGKSAEHYQSAEKEYKKAVLLSREFKFKEEEKRASRLLFKSEKKMKEIELEFSIETGDKSEKNKDYIKAIHNYQNAIKIMEENLIYSVSDPRIKKLKRKILKLREEI
ncbi:MAG: hypothetical protein KGD66_00540 [Candidatus Lokiarchaeota archaeon]|nr:hypothetical protein [Candidatus Lokiarchaeota archaeon]